MSTLVKPFDPMDSPGPIPSILERFRPRRSDEPDRDGPEARAARYTVVLVPPEAAEALGHDRCDTGLKVYLDDDWDCDVAHLDEAARLITEECGVPVSLVERHADLCYWTAKARP